MTFIWRFFMMRVKWVNVLSFVVLVLFLAGSHSLLALGQSANSSAADVKHDKINFEVQLYLLVAYSEAGGKANIPQSLESVVRQLKPLLPFPNYHLAATFVNRVQDGGTLQSSGIGSSDMFITGPQSEAYPLHCEFTLKQVQLDTGAANQPVIDIGTLRFGLQVPIITGQSHVEGNIWVPIVNYQHAGITTEMSLREGTPTVVATMNTNRPDQTLILVISVKRTL
jgi:hypothetical protein